VTDTLHVNVPPGIGDISWIHSKLSTLGRPLHYHVALHKKERSVAFGDILEGVVGADVGNFSFAQLKGKAIDPLKPLPELDWMIGEGPVSINLNPFLESGRRLETAFPGTGTNLHYNFNLTEGHHGVAGQLVKGREDKKLFGVYTSGGNILRAWGGWGPANWVEFIQRWLDRFSHDWIPVIIGAPYDRVLTDLLEERLEQRGIEYIVMVGYHLGAVVSLMSHLEFLIGFPSGICILANVIRTPCYMQYHRGTHSKLTQAWHDPDVPYRGQFFGSVNDTFDSVVEMMKCVPSRST